MYDRQQSQFMTTFTKLRVEGSQFSFRWCHGNHTGWRSWGWSNCTGCWRSSRCRWWLRWQQFNRWSSSGGWRLIRQWSSYAALAFHLLLSWRHKVHLRHRPIFQSTDVCWNQPLALSLVTSCWTCTMQTKTHTLCRKEIKQSQNAITYTYTNQSLRFLHKYLWQSKLSSGHLFSNQTSVVSLHYLRKYTPLKLLLHLNTVWYSVTQNKALWHYNFAHNFT